MVDPKQIPSLLKLLEDDSQDIQEHVVTVLASFGPTLKSELKARSLILNDLQKKRMDGVLETLKKRELLLKWSRVMDMVDENEQLELAVTSLSQYLCSFDSDCESTILLDSLAMAYKDKYDVISEEMLAHFLFKERKLSGNEKNYYDPQNSNIVSVIRNKKGIPLSLSIVYILVGGRLGLKIQGCNFPGHFLAKINYKGERAYVDCFSNGQIIEEYDIVKIRENMVEDIDHILNEKASTITIIKRYLANLVRAFQMIEDESRTILMIDLFKNLDFKVQSRMFADITPDQLIADIKPEFNQGQIVKHKRYGYRGIIVDMDLDCQASESWYYGNQTQPKRSQPWYQVLVSGTEQVTYVAENNLVSDSSEELIKHPLVTYFFTRTDDGDYIRNSNPWPEAEDGES